MFLWKELYFPKQIIVRRVAPLYIFANLFKAWLVEDKFSYLLQHSVCCNMLL